MLFNELNKISISIDRIKKYEPPEGYYLAFSGGKDSQVIYHLSQMAGVKLDAHYYVTTVDPPELMAFIKKKYSDVIFDLPEITMWDLIIKKHMPPTRVVRYCCQYLKEGYGFGRVVMTGIRYEESINRRSWDIYNVRNKSKHKRKIIFNPIIDWLEWEVWEFLEKNNIKWCSLYDELEIDRLGCIGCPMQGPVGQKLDFNRWPTYKKKYIKAFQKMVDERISAGLPTKWVSGEDVMEWWLKF